MCDGSRGSLQSMSSTHSVLDGLYALHDELGSGGFGKVRLSTHLLTGQKVAIKIIDKKAIGDDLPRVRTELDALQHLQHQNVCRLYQSIETEDKFYIVMEYCSGGEMFDYIVKKARLEESEARHFFRQLVQAIAFIHSQGYAHRDLKPENLLLTEDLHLKVIDFGLCARPETPSRPLETCCGSPAYAAPELIQGNPYIGSAADVWSMGVLLYALLVGALPFEDDTMPGLYRKIMKGIYPEPEFLSDCSKKLLWQMLRVNPKERLSVRQLLDHPWLNKKYSQPVKWNTIYDKNVVDEEVARELAFHHSLAFSDMLSLIKEWRFDYLTATYFILLQMKRKGDKFALPGPRATKKDICNVVNSPTIHASLDTDLDRSGVEENEGREEEGRERDVCFELPHSPKSSPTLCDDKQKSSYASAMLNMRSVMSGRSPQQRLPPLTLSPCHTPSDKKGYQHRYVLDSYEIDKENTRNAGTSLRVRGPIRVTSGEDSTRPRSVYTTPQRGTVKGLFSPAGNPPPTTPSTGRARQATSLTDQLLGNGNGSSGEEWERRKERGYQPGSSPSSVNQSDLRTPRSATKTPRLRSRVFASLERKADKMMNLLTPRKIRNEGPERLTSDKGMVNLSLTASLNPEQIRNEIVSALNAAGIKHEVSGWKISGRLKDSMGHSLQFDLDIVIVETANCVGVRRKRLQGDAFLYKKVCETILRAANI